MFPVVSQTITATPPLLSVKVAYRNPKTGLARRASQKKLASEANRATRGVARNSIGNRATWESKVKEQRWKSIAFLMAFSVVQRFRKGVGGQSGKGVGG